MSKTRVRVPLVIMQEGVPVDGATVLIRDRSTGSFATLYASPIGAATVPNPVNTTVFGEVEAYVDRGSYNAYITRTGTLSHVQPFEASPADDNSIDTGWRKHYVQRLGATSGVPDYAFPLTASVGDMVTVKGGSATGTSRQYVYTFAYRTGITTSTGTGAAWVNLGGPAMVQKSNTSSGNLTIATTVQKNTMPGTLPGVLTSPGFWRFGFSIPTYLGGNADTNHTIAQNVGVAFMPGIIRSGYANIYGTTVGAINGPIRSDLDTIFTGETEFFVPNTTEMWTTSPRTLACYDRFSGSSALTIKAPWVSYLYPIHINARLF